MNKEQLLKNIEIKSAELNAALKTEDLDAIKSLTNEVSDLKNTLNVSVEAEVASTPVNFAGISSKSEESEFEWAIKEAINAPGKEFKLDNYDLKTTATTAAGVPGQKLSTGIVFRGSNPRTSFVDALDSQILSSVSQVFYRQNTRTNNAAAGDEGVAPTDNVNTFDEVVITAKPVISWIPVSEAMLVSADRRVLLAFEQDVVTMAKQALDNELIDGSVLNSMNAISAGSLAGTGTVAGTGLIRDAVFTGQMAIEAAGDFATKLVVHPSDWAKIANQKTTQNDYIWSGDVEMYLGMQVVRDAHVAAGTAFIVGSQNKYGILGGLTLDYGYNAADFSAGRKSLRAIVHANSIYRPLSIYKLTIS